MATRRMALALLALFGLLQAARVPAQGPASVALTWSAPKGCPSAEEVRARVHKLAGATSVAAPLRAEATVRHEEGELRLRLVIHAENLVGERHIEGRSCHDLAGATAVALALLLRSSTPLTAADLTGSAPTEERRPEPARTTATPGEVAGAAPTAAPSSAATPATAAVAVSPGKQRGWRALLQIPLLMVGVGPLHRPSYGVALAAGMSLPRWLGLSEGRVWLPQRTSADAEGDDSGAEIQRFAAGLRGGYAFLWPGFQLTPCVALSVEHMRARGSGPHVASSQAKTSWISAGIGLQARVPLARWLKLVAGIELQIQTSRPEIAIDGVGVIEQLLPVAAMFTLAPEWIL